MVLQNLKNVLLHAPIFPPRQTGGDAGILLLLEQGVIHSPEKCRTQQPLLALSCASRKRCLDEKCTRDRRRNIHEQAGAAVGNRIVLVVRGCKEPLLRSAASAWILHYVHRSGNACTIETKTIADVADLPSASGCFRERPPLARVCKTP